MKEIISFNSVSFGYGTDLVLEDVDLKIYEGEFITVIGPNGGGKSTLLKLILGLVSPLKGEVRVFGRKPGKVSSLIGHLPQNYASQGQFPISVFDVVMMGATHKLRYTDSDYRKCNEILEKLNLENIKDMQFNDLSGGQKQRVMIARSLVGGPKVLILDEPTSNMDRVAEESFWNYLKGLDERLTIVLVSHDLTFVSKQTDKAVCISKNVHVHAPSDLTEANMLKVLQGNVKLIEHDHSFDSNGRHIHD